MPKPKYPHPHLHIYQLRRDAGLKVCEVCQNIPITESNLSRIERGQQGLSIATAVALAEFYGVSLDFIIHGEDSDMAVDPTMDDSVFNTPIPTRERASGQG